MSSLAELVEQLEGNDKAVFGMSEETTFIFRSKVEPIGSGRDSV
jgi:hypothetical protein